MLNQQMQPDKGNPMQYTLIFHKSEQVPWWAKRLKFTHVAIIKHLSNGIDVGIDGKRWGILMDAQESLKIKRGIVVKLSTNHEENIISGMNKNPRVIAFPTLGTCVSLIKKIAGIRKPFIITPNQLYKWILSYDARKQGFKVFCGPLDAHQLRRN